MALVRIPAPLRTRSCPPTETLSSSLTPPTSAAIATAVDTASASVRSRLVDVLIEPPETFKAIRRRAVPAAEGPARFARPLLHRVRQLQPHDVDVAPVRTADQAVRGGVALVLIDVRIFHPDVCIGSIEREIRRKLVLRAEREPGPIVVRQPGSAELIANRRLIVGETAAERPRVVVPIIRADRAAPGIAEILRRR